MQNILYKSAITALCLVASLPASGVAQTARGDARAGSERHELRGRVVSSAGSAPIAHALVDVLALGGTTVLERGSTADDGSFRIDGVRAGVVRVRVRALGYSPRVLDSVRVADGAAPQSLGVIALTVAPLELQKLVVTGTHREIDLAPDRSSYAVRNMPTTRGGTVIDVLRNIPSVDVDIDNTVSLRGNTGVVVQINGRPSPLRGSQLGNFLAQLPADLVAKVEVVPNPSAKEDPEGEAGIINIVMKKEADAGGSGGLTVSGGTTGRLELGGNAGYQRGGLTAYGSYGFMRDQRPRSESIFRDNLFADPTTYLQETGHRTQTPLAHTVTGTLGYKVAKSDAFSADFMYSTRSETGTNSLLYRDLDASQAVTGMQNRFSQGTNHEFNLESALGWDHRFARDGHTLSAELRVFRGREGGPDLYTTSQLAPSGELMGTPALESRTGWEHPGEGSLKVDYARPLSSRVRVEAGYKGTDQSYHTTLDTRMFDSTRAAYVVDSSQTSDFTYDQLVHAGYGMVDAAPGKFELQGGVRVERAVTHFRLNRIGTRYDNAYNSVFPSALVAFNPDESHQVKLSYSTRIWRPDDSDLIDPTIRYQDPLNLSRGNPYLKPQYIRALELGLQRQTDRSTFQLTPFYRHASNAVRRLRTIDSTGVTTTTFANVATSDDYGADATMALHGGRLSGFAGASAFRRVSNAANLGPEYSTRTFGWSARTNATLRATRTLDLQTLVFYRGPMTVEQGRMSSRTRVSLAARQKLDHDRVDLTLRIVDPFRTDYERFTTVDPAFRQEQLFSRNDRGVLLSVSWRFGQAPKIRDRGQDDPAGGDSGPP